MAGATENEALAGLHVSSKDLYCIALYHMRSLR